MPTRRCLRVAEGLLAAGIAGLAFTTAAAAPADASPSARTYANCTAIRQVYSGGIAKAGVTYTTVRSHGTTYHRALKGDVKFSTALYNANAKSDADHDGIACEKS